MGVVFGLALARRALALSLAEPSRFEVTLRFENSELDLGPKEWPTCSSASCNRYVWTWSS